MSSSRSVSLGLEGMRRPSAIRERVADSLAADSVEAEECRRRIEAVDKYA